MLLTLQYCCITLWRLSYLYSSFQPTSTSYRSATSTWFHSVLQPPLAAVSTSISVLLSTIFGTSQYYFFGTSSAAQCFFVLIVVLSALLSTSQYYFWYVSALLGYFQDVTGTSHYYFWYFQHCYVLLGTIFCTSQYDSGTFELRSVLLSTIFGSFHHCSVLFSTIFGTFSIARYFSVSIQFFCTSQHWALGLCLRRRCESGVRIEKTTIGTSQYHFWYVSALLRTSQYYFLCVSALLGTSEY